MTKKIYSRRRFLGTAAAVLFMLSLCGAAEGNRRPNIIFMFADDQAYESMGYTGNTVIQTPNMDRLARDGVFFHHANGLTPWASMP